jgi:hypothetical protein
MRRQPAVGLVVLCLALASATPLAQSPLFEATGNRPLDHLGTAVAAVGDVDGDGVVDVALGAPSEPGGASSPGSVRVVSGDDGSLIHEIRWVAAGEGLFGQALAGVGDADGDGVDDLVAGFPTAGPSVEESRVVLISGQSGQILIMLGTVGSDPWDAFGWSLARLGDLDGDGRQEYAVGAPSLSDEGPGRVYVLRSSADPSTDFVLYELEGLAPGDRFGISVASAGFVDADAVPDLIVGSGEGGYARVYAGATGELLLHLASGAAGFGRTVAAAGDVNGDGLGDVAVGSPDDDVVDVLSGDNGALLRRFEIPSGAAANGFGSALADLGDRDGDGVHELFIGAPFETVLDTEAAGSAYVISGDTGIPLLRLSGEPSDSLFGAALAALPDTDLDGHAELLVGSPGQPPLGPAGGGRAALYPGDLAGAIVPYGFGCPGSFLITPAIELSGEPRPAGGLTLAITRGLGGSTAFVFFGLGQGFSPLANGCVLWVEPLTGPVLALPLEGTFPGSGTAVVTDHVPAAVPPGTVVTMQAFIADDGVEGGFSTTGAVQLTVLEPGD